MKIVGLRVQNSGYALNLLVQRSKSCLDIMNANLKFFLLTSTCFFQQFYVFPLCCNMATGSVCFLEKGPLNVANQRIEEKLLKEVQKWMN